MDFPEDPLFCPTPPPTRGSETAGAVAGAARADATPRKEAPRTAAGARSRNITVLCRMRPEDAIEASLGAKRVVEVDGRSVVVTPEGGTDKLNFPFTAAFPSVASTAEVYAHLGPALVDHIFTGVSATVFAYGATSSGKTYSLLGTQCEKTGHVTDPSGVLPLLLRDIFARKAELEDSCEVSLTLSAMELYMEKIYCLLSDDDRSRQEPRELRGGGDDPVYVEGLVSVSPTSAADALSIIVEGQRRRFTAATNANRLSSRSHALFLLTAAVTDVATRVTSTAQLYVVDSAGSERTSKTLAAGQRLEEAKLINTSLLALQQVISALAQKRTNRTMHVPYRDSKLTRLLQHSLGGNSLTFMLLTVAPSQYNLTETLSTLRFGITAQQLKTTPVRNVQRSAEELERLLEAMRVERDALHAQVATLRAQVRTLQVAASTSGNGGGFANFVSTPTHALVAAGSGAAVALAAAARDRQVRELFIPVARSDAAIAQLLSVLSAARNCPLTGRPMREPAVALDGVTYERAAIARHLTTSDMRSPVTGARLPSALTVPNIMLRNLLDSCHDAGFAVPRLNEHVDALGFTAPASPFDCFDVASEILDFLPLEEQLGFARVNLLFARAVFARERWAAPIAALLDAATPETRARIAAQTAALPAHKVFQLLRRIERAEKAEGPDAADRIVSTALRQVTTLVLFSTSLKRR